jgi:hypothetical protein
METAQILTDLRVERDRINQAIAALEALNGTVSGTTPRGSGLKSAKATVPESKPSSAKRVVSPESRKLMAEAQRKRWAKKKRAAKTAVKKASSIAVSAK